MRGKPITILHLSDLQFGKNHRFPGLDLSGAPNAHDSLLARLWDDLRCLREGHKVAPDLVVVTGDLAEWGMREEFRAVREFLEKLTDKDHLNLPRERVAIVPGNHDVNRDACVAYFANCKADGEKPVAPWWPKWRQFVAMFEELYRAVPGVSFSVEQPWTLFEVPDLKVVIAGLNSTMVEGHDCQEPGRTSDPLLPRHVGWVGEPQLRWFAERLAKRREQGWLRIAAVHHNQQRGCRDDEENLTDADDLARILGPEINLILHGHRHRAELGWVSPHLPILSTGSAALSKDVRPEEIPNQYQVIQVFPGQVLRFGRAFFPERKSFGPDARIGKNDGTATDAAVLQDVYAAFPESETTVPGRKRGDEKDGVELGRDHWERAEGLLARAAEVCRLRYPQAEVTPFPREDGHPAYLRISDPSGHIVCPRPVGIFDTGLTREELHLFASSVDALYRSADTGLVSEIVSGGEPPADELVQEAWRRRIKVRSFLEFQGLIDFAKYVRIQTGRLQADPIYPPGLYVAQRMCFQRGEDRYESDDALAQVQTWLNSSGPSFVIILGDFGTGKTFLLHELARRMGESDGALVPMFIELRALEKAQSLDTLVAQHLAKSEEKHIDLSGFRYMLRQGRIVLFFDGFDELALRVSYDRAAEHFATLVQAAEGEAKVVVTSRTQHFESEKQVRTVLYERAQPLPGLRYCKLHPFRGDQIEQFLRKRWRDAEDPAKEAEEWLALIHEVKDLYGLSETPRMLGFITDLRKQDLLKARNKDKSISPAELYRLLVERWLGFEYERVHPKGAQVVLSREARFAAVTAVAIRLWEKTEKFLTSSELSEVTSGVVAKAMSTPPPADIATHLIGSGSLLRRDDEGCFSFVHQSVMEWLVAAEAATQIKQTADSSLLATRELSPLMADFFCGLAGEETALAWATQTVRRVAVGSDMGKRNALTVVRSATGRNPALVLEDVPLNLAGQDLRGRDFGDESLVNADLSGADLTEARLGGKDLTGAKLAKARLVRADLSKALLVRADLSHADLSQAKLAGADLREADLDGAIFRRGVLVGAHINAKALAHLDLHGAALPDDKVALPWTISGLSPCNGVAWNPRLGILATGHADKTVRLWDPATGKQVQTLLGHQDSVRSVAFSADGRWLASGSGDNTVRLWDPATGKQLQTLLGDQASVSSVAFSADGRWLASGSDDKTVRLWDPATGERLQSLSGHQYYVGSVAFSADGRWLASGSGDRTVCLWDPATGKHLQFLFGHQDSVRSVAFSADGRWLASGSDDKTVRLWDPATGKQLQSLLGHQDSVRSVAFSADGRWLASGSRDNTVRLWDPATGKQLQSLSGHQASVFSVVFSADGRWLASGSGDNAVRLWDPATGKQLQSLSGHQASVLSVAFSADGRWLASGSADKTARLWDPATGRQLQSLSGHQDYVLGVAFSADGRWLASGSGDKTVRLWDPATGKQLQSLFGHQAYVWSVAFSVDGRWLASGSGDNTVRLWDPATGKQLQSLSGHQASVLSVAFSADGRWLASGSADKTARLWDPATGKQLQSLSGHQASVFSVAFSADGRWLASGSGDKTVRLWDPATGKRLQSLSGHQDYVRSVAFSSDGRWLASGSADKTVRLWDPATGKQVQTLLGHQDYVRSVAFSADGRCLASGSDDKTLRLWNVKSGACVAVLLGLPEGWVAFTPDGRYKLGGSVAGNFWHTINLCRFEVGELDEFIPGLRLPPDHRFLP